MYLWPSSFTCMEFTVNQIAELVGGTVEGDGSQIIDSISALEKGKSGSIAFLSNPKYESFIYNTQASAVLVGSKFKPKDEVAAVLIKVEDPYSSLTLLLEEYQKLTSMSKTGIEDPSFIAETAFYGSNCYFGAFTYVGKGVSIGENVKIYPNSYIGEGSKIGDNTVIYSGVNIYANTQIGSHCVIHSGAVIGSDGFGFAAQSDGTYKSVPQVGNVIIEDHVSIGSNTVIDCGTFNATVIKRGVKIDNLIQVAHNVEIGENTVIAAQAGIAGSTTIGSQCVIGGQAGIVGHIHIADQTKIQAQSGVTKNTKEGEAIYGSPALGYNNYIRSYSVFRKLPEVLDRIERLEEKLLTLPPTEKD